jgi:hypothetical protein
MLLMRGVKLARETVLAARVVLVRSAKLSARVRREVCIVRLRGRVRRGVKMCMCNLWVVGK